MKSIIVHQVKKNSEQRRNNMISAIEKSANNSPIVDEAYEYRIRDDIELEKRIKLKSKGSTDQHMPSDV